MRLTCIVLWIYYLQCLCQVIYLVLKGCQALQSVKYDEGIKFLEKAINSIDSIYEKERYVYTTMVLIAHVVANFEAFQNSILFLRSIPAKKASIDIRYTSKGGRAYGTNL